MGAPPSGEAVVMNVFQILRREESGAIKIF